MIRLAVAVEGPTEKEFVGRLLSKHLMEVGVAPTPVVLGRGRGGNVGVDRVTHEMVRLYWSFDVVTSLVDYYGFRDKGTRTVDELELHLLEQVRKRISGELRREAIIPYVQRHEFESLLFADVDVFAGLPTIPPGLTDALREIRSRFPTPEDINDDSETAPSKRIGKLMPSFRKPVAGLILAEAAGLNAIRAECPRFDRWLARLESLGRSTGGATANADP